jgi:hypothetical protein
MQQRRLRNSFDSESSLLDWFRTGFSQRACAFIPEDPDPEDILEAVLDGSSWKNLSGKGDPPPDFVNPSQMLMLEIMRVDDHERPGDKKGFVNPVRQRESEILKEHEGRFRELLDRAAEGVTLTVVGKTDLPTGKDHSYAMYLDSFERIVIKHANHADLYRQNNPGYKLVFFVFDESSAYCEPTTRVAHEIREGYELRGRPHYHFADAAFLKVIRNSKADYFIWYAPFHYEHLFAEGLLLPETTVYDVSHINVPVFHYDAARMVSMEV